MDELAYANYRRQRETAPEISPRAWAQVLPGVEEMERRYQQEINDYANAMVKRDKEEPRWLRELNTGARDKTNGLR